MSKGSPIIHLRMKPDDVARLDGTIERINQRRKEEPYTRTTFILAAIEAKMDHLERSAKKTKKKLTTAWPPVIMYPP